MSLKTPVSSISNSGLKRSVLFFCSNLGVATRRTSGRNFSAHARHYVGVRCVLCRAHGCKLDVPLYPPYPFLIRDYNVFDCSGLAHIEDRLNLDRECNRPVLSRSPVSRQESVHGEGSNLQKSITRQSVNSQLSGSTLQDVQSFLSIVTRERSN